MKQIRLLAFALPLTLMVAACGSTVGPMRSSALDAENDLCLASTWRDRFVGKTEQQAQIEIGPLMREGKAQIVTASTRGALDQPGRLTFEMGSDRRVAQIYCG